ncbi:MAG: YceI family protein [Chloroflexi bacterium]|nr:YceI family protein [Chloroflexota bacterium]
MSWTVDYAHSQIQFSVRHMMISTVRGHFGKFNVKAEIDEQDVPRSQVEVQIEAASLDTGMPPRDAHLRSPDFFDAEKYPLITFKSKRAENVNEAGGKLIGYLTIRDVTREVALDVEYNGQAKSPWGAISAGFNARTKLNRKQWDLNWNKALESGGWLVGDDVTVAIEIEFTKQPEPVKQPAVLEAVAA